MCEEAVCILPVLDVASAPNDILIPMNRSVIIALLVGIVVIVGVWLWPGKVNAPQKPVITDYKSATYTIDGQPVTLVNGRAETPSVPGSASKTVTQYFGNDATGDLNGDGRPDVAFILTQSGGGSGTFYYVVVALKTAAGYEGTNGVVLGDRIAPQTTEIKDGELIVNYADRRGGEPMTAQPSMGVSKYLKVQGMALAEIPPQVGAGAHCGGNMTTAATCSAGYHCAPTPGSHLPFGDVGGTCVAN